MVLGMETVMAEVGWIVWGIEKGEEVTFGGRRGRKQDMQAV
jgi:hypothetical protein